MPSKFKYRGRSEADVDKHANQQGGSFIGFIKDDYRTYKPVKGDNFIRILPSTMDDNPDYALEIHAHYGIGPDNASVLCLNRMKGKHCPICEAAQVAKREGDDDLVKELSARKRYVVWMLDKKKEDAGPIIWDMSYTIERDISKISKDRQSGAILNIDHPDDGYDISFDRDGEGLKTRYSGFQVGRKPTSIDEKWLDYVVENPLDETLIFRTYDEIKTIFEGGEKEEKSKAQNTRRDADEDRPRGRQRDPEPQTEDDEPPPRAARSRQAEPEDDEPPFKPNTAKSRASADDEPAPKTSRRNAPPAEEEDDDTPPQKPRQRAREPEPEDDEPEPEKPTQSARKQADEDDDGYTMTKKESEAARTAPAEDNGHKSRAQALKEKLRARNG